jgi:hypothetical protein
MPKLKYPQSVETWKRMSTAEKIAVVDEEIRWAREFRATFKEEVEKRSVLRELNAPFDTTLQEIERHYNELRRGLEYGASAPLLAGSVQQIDRHYQELKRLAKQDKQLADLFDRLDVIG